MIARLVPGLVAGVYRLGRLAVTPLVGAVAAVLLLTRFDYAFLAARGYIDIPYMALVVWAAALEAARPRRGVPVLLLLALAGLLRPEAWLLAGDVLALGGVEGDLARSGSRYAALAAIGPLCGRWLDCLVTGDPLFSLHYTGGSAEDLGRQRTLVGAAGRGPGVLRRPRQAAGAGGRACSGSALGDRDRAAPRWPCRSRCWSRASSRSSLIGVAGASVIERYLAVAALALLVFAAVALGGWTMLRPGRLRTAWTVARGR